MVNSITEQKHLRGYEDGTKDRTGSNKLASFSSDDKAPSKSKKKESIPPWLDTIYEEVKFTKYSTDSPAKKSDITSGKTVNATKRTIRIGNQVCGSKRDDKRDLDDDAKTSEIIGRVHGCCAEHNKCPRSVPAKGVRYGFTNDIEYSIMSCKCDNAFRKCLKDVKSYTADAIGHLYFDALKIPCLTFHDEPTNEKPHADLDMISVIPDVAISHPKIGGAQVVLKPNDNRLSNDFFYTHEQQGVADSKEAGRMSSHPHLVRMMQYPTPKLPLVTGRMISKFLKLTGNAGSVIKTPVMTHDKKMISK